MAIVLSLLPRESKEGIIMGFLLSQQDRDSTFFIRCVFILISLKKKNLGFMTEEGGAEI